MGLLALTACTTTSLPPLHTIDTKSVSAVQAEIKRQIGVYVRNVNDDRAARSAPSVNKADHWCGSGKLDFEITSVKVDLLTSQDDTGKANVGLTIPISAFTIGPSASHSYEATNVQELICNEWLTSAGQTPDASFPRSLIGGQEKDAPLAQILGNLRAGLIEAARKSKPPLPANGPQACFSAYNQIPSKASDDPADSVKIAFTAVEDTTGGVTLNLGVVALGGSYEAKNTAASTITVSFREVGSENLKVCTNNPKQICEADAKTPHQGDDHFFLGPPAPGGPPDPQQPATPHPPRSD